MNANIGSMDLSHSRVISANHPPIVAAESVLEDVGVIADGQIVAKDKDGETVAHKSVADVAMTGTVDGTNKTFTGTLAPAPVLPGTVVIANNNATAQEVTDDGQGNLVGDGTGTIVYKTGAVSVTFTTAPAVGKTVLVSHKTQPTGVNIDECDTAEDDTARVLIHGTVNRDLLLTGADAASDEDVAALKSLGIFAI